MSVINQNYFPYNSQFLKHLIRFPYFKNELISNNNSSQIYIGYLIKNEILEKFKEKYVLKKLLDILKENKLLDGINYQNCDSNYPNIIKFLNEKNNTYLNDIKKIENTEIPYIIKPNDSFISTKFINNKQSKLIYLDEFEIIDKDFALHLQNIYKNNIQIFPVYYILIEGKIILSIFFGQQYIYEIVYINPDRGNIIVEYLIQPLIFCNMSTDINSIIFQIFLKNGIQKIIDLRSSIKVTDNIIFNFHKINAIITNNNKTILNMHNYLDKKINQGNQNKNIIPVPKGKGELFLSNKESQQNLDNELMKSQISDFHIEDGYLIDKVFYIFMLQYLNLDNNEPYNNQILNKNNINDFNTYKIQRTFSIINNKKLYYPIDFDIISKPTFDKINKILMLKTPNNLFEEIKYFKINNRFIFISKNNNFLFNNNNLIYLYSSKIYGQIQLNEPIALIECNSINERNNKIILINKELSNKNIINDLIAYFHKINLSCHLICTNTEIINELKYYKAENEKLKNEINKLKAEFKSELNNFEKNISSYEQKIKENVNKINNLQNIIKEKEKEINDLRIKTGKYVDFNKIMVINFMSQDQNVNFGIKCLETNTFAEVEEKLYQEYENYRETNNSFVCKGSPILRFKTILENNIKNGDKIQLIKPE